MAIPLYLASDTSGISVPDLDTIVRTCRRSYGVANFISTSPICLQIMDIGATIGTHDRSSVTGATSSNLPSPQVYTVGREETLL